MEWPQAAAEVPAWSHGQQLYAWPPVVLTWGRVALLTGVLRVDVAGHGRKGWAWVTKNWEAGGDVETKETVKESDAEGAKKGPAVSPGR